MPPSSRISMPDEIPPPVAPSDDPRMHGFRTRTSVEEAVALIDRRVGPLPAETIDFRAAAGRVLAEAVRAAEPVPAFDRAAMDGYAIRGEETFGAGPVPPGAFRRAGDARPGRRCEVQVGPGEAVQITTGSALPTGADAVVKVESTRAQGDSILVFEATPPGRHVGRRGEDIAAGTIVLPAGRVLRPQDLGALSAVAARSIAVVRRPSVAVLVTGDELLEPGTPARGVQIADVNSVMLAALIARDGGSAGPEDYAPGLVAELGELAVHGVALRPASPAGVGFLGAVPVVLLPGNPVSCLCAYDFFAGPIVRRLGGRPRAWPYRALALPLAKELVSVVGRVDYARVRIEQGQVEPLAISGASILSSTTRADGFVVIPADRAGYPAGTSVTVWSYEECGDDPQ